ncbi:MAG: Transcription factor WhiB [Frankiales bacterium]|nr:Transcription factor WhiB [Frankiales bacterium]
MPTPPMAVPSLDLDTEWTADAACRRADAVHFYPPSTGERREDKRRRESAARVLCSRCPVQRACLEYSLVVQEPHGIWGGLNELERRRLLRKRAAEQPGRVAEPRHQTAAS